MARMPADMLSTITGIPMRAATKTGSMSAPNQNTDRSTMATTGIARTRVKGNMRMSLKVDINPEKKPNIPPILTITRIAVKTRRRDDAK